MGFWRTRSTQDKPTNAEKSSREPDPRMETKTADGARKGPESGATVQDHVMNMLAVHDEVRARLLASPPPRFF